MRPETDADAEWVAHLTGRPLDRARAALAEARAQRSLFAYVTRQHRREGRGSYIEIDAPLELFALVRLLRPDHVVEVGVSSGVSSGYLLSALSANGAGRLHSIDLPSFERRPNGHGPPQNSWSLPPGRSPGWAIPPRLRTAWDLRLGDKADVLPMLTEQLPRVDLLVYDVPHDCPGTLRELRQLRPLFGQNSVTIVDHGPSGGLCPALASWAWEWHTRPYRRQGLGLFGARCAHS